MSYGQRVRRIPESVISSIIQYEPLRLISFSPRRSTLAFRLQSMEIRSATTLDVPLIAKISRLARELEMPHLPVLHTPDEDLAFFTAEISSSDCLVALVDGVVVGFGCVRSGWLNHLYVAPEFQGRGIGSALLGQFAGAIDQFWVFQANTRARTFYRSHGFVEAEYTDGSANEEREPDVRFIATL